MSVKPLSPRMHAIFWIIAIVVFTATILLFKSMLLPFVLGIAVAYLLNPVVNKFGEVGISRAPASIIILGNFLILIMLLIGVVSPVLYREIAQFSKDLPDYLEKIMAMLGPYTAQLDQYIGGDSGQSIETIIKQNSSSAVGVANYVVKQIAAGGQVAADVVSVVVFMPIVAYYMMKEWPSITQWVRDLMPRHSEDVIMGLLKEIDAKLAGFVRGQISVAVVLGISYAVILTVAGLKYGFLIGLMSGFLSIIPMVGSAVGLIVSIAVAWFQSGDLMFVGLIGAIFIAGQLIEGNFLTPKLVGDSVGLHPLWVFFSLLAGGALLGILGMFLAVPVAAVVGVLIGFGIRKYKQSPYYQEPLTEDKSAEAVETQKHPAKKKTAVVKVKAKSKA